MEILELIQSFITPRKVMEAILFLQAYKWVTCRNADEMLTIFSTFIVSLLLYISVLLSEQTEVMKASRACPSPHKIERSI